MTDQLMAEDCHGGGSEHETDMFSLRVAAGLEEAELDGDDMVGLTTGNEHVFDYLVREFIFAIL